MVVRTNKRFTVPIGYGEPFKKNIHKLLVFIRKQVEQQLALRARLSLYLQFGVNLIHILPDTALGQIQLFRDLAVVQSLRHQPDNLIFPLGQRRQGFRTVKSGLSPLCGFSQFNDLRNRSGLQPLCQQWLEIAISA